jgi:hypothetical protein
LYNFIENDEGNKVFMQKINQRDDENNSALDLVIKKDNSENL